MYNLKLTHAIHNLQITQDSPWEQATLHYQHEEFSLFYKKHCMHKFTGTILKLHLSILDSIKV